MHKQECYQITSEIGTHPHKIYFSALCLLSDGLWQSEACFKDKENGKTWQESFYSGGPILGFGVAL